MGRPKESICPRGHDKEGRSRCRICWSMRRTEYKRRLRSGITRPVMQILIHRAWR